MQIISSQRYTDEDIVAEKIEACDFDVLVSPEFEIDGETYCVILDGHHSFAAAKAAGVCPSYSTATACEHDAVGLLDKGDIETFLEATHMGDDYYNVDTGECIW